MCVCVCVCVCVCSNFVHLCVSSGAPASGKPLAPIASVDDPASAEECAGNFGIIAIGDSGVWVRFF